MASRLRNVSVFLGVSMSCRAMRWDRRSSVSASGPRLDRTFSIRLLGYPSLLAYCRKGVGSVVGVVRGLGIGRIAGAGRSEVVGCSVADTVVRVTVAPAVLEVVSSWKDIFERADSIVDVTVVVFDVVSNESRTQ